MIEPVVLKLVAIVNGNFELRMGDKAILLLHSCLSKWDINHLCNQIKDQIEYESPRKAVLEIDEETQAKLDQQTTSLSENLNLNIEGIEKL